MTENQQSTKGGLNTSALQLKQAGIVCICVETAGREIRFFTDEALANKVSPERCRAYPFTSVVADLDNNAVRFTGSINEQEYSWTFDRDKISYKPVTGPKDVVAEVASQTKPHSPLPKITMLLTINNN